MMKRRQKSLFGKFNPVIDESGHLLYSLVISFVSYLFGLDLYLVGLVFLSAFLIDLDHFLNPVMARILGIKEYGRRISYGHNGHTFKVLHGFDMFLLIAIVGYFLYSNWLFWLFIYINLCVHECWDFVVYPHSWRELFLVTRCRNKFNPGLRWWFVGRIFDYKSLKF